MRSKSELRRLAIQLPENKVLVDEILFLQGLLDDFARVANRDDKLVLNLLSRKEAYEKTKIDTKKTT